MSSTTDGRRARGQILVIFALSITAIFIVAALAFDGGAILVQQRDQQNAADAAAIAGARFLPAGTAPARAAAIDIARRNGFEDGVNGAIVTINIPPTSGAFTSLGTGAIEVLIESTRESVFAGVIGRFSWDVGTRAVAANQERASGPFAMLALHETACPALRVEGSGVLNSNGNIQVNSSCTTGDRAFRVAGTGSLVLTAEGVGCNVVGGATQGGGVASNDCDPVNTGASEIPDPFEDKPYPSVPTAGSPPVIVYPDAAVQEGGTTRAIPAGCPDGDPATPASDTTPAACVFGGAYAGTTWRLFPGYYPGGLDLRGGTFYLEPGIYHIADGGFRTAGGSVAVTSVDIGGTTLGGGVLIFNTTHASTATSPGQVVIQGGDSGVNLWPLDDGSEWDSFVILQDAAVTLDVEIVGGSSDMELRGVIYAPSANVAVRGNAGTLTMDQVIASTFEIRGNGGTINVAYDTDFLPDLSLAGLVE